MTKKLSLRGIPGAATALRRHLKSFTGQVKEGGAARALARASARLNRLDIVQFGLRGAILPFLVRTLKDRVTVEPGPDEVLVFSVVRDGMPWLRTFLSHHRELGARKFVILDNGSNDGTVEYLTVQDDVVLLASDAPYRHYENTFKRYLCDRYGRDRWCLFVDVDELLAYPGMHCRSLKDLAAFTGQMGFTGVITQMLDMFAPVSMAEIPEGPDLDLRELCRCYETADIDRTSYTRHKGTVAPENARMHWGGVRRRVFGTNNGLTKVSLFFNGGGLVPFHRWHHVRNGHLADYSVALLHYPFNRRYRDRVLAAAADGRYGWLTTDEYQAYARIMRDNPELRMMSDASRRYQGPEQLVAEGFLESSPAFANWAATCAAADASRQDSMARKPN